MDKKYFVVTGDGMFVAVQRQDIQTATHFGGGWITVSDPSEGALQFPNEEAANRFKTIIPKIDRFKGLRVVPENEIEFA